MLDRSSTHFCHAKQLPHSCLHFSNRYLHLCAQKTSCAAGICNTHLSQVTVLHTHPATDSDCACVCASQGGDLKSALQTAAGREKLQWHRQGSSVALDIIKGLHFLHAHKVSAMPPTNALPCCWLLSYDLCGYSLRSAIPKLDYSNTFDWSKS